MSVPKEIGHLVLNVSDVERSTKFYRDVVGFQVSRYRPDGTGAFLTCGVVHHNLALFKAPAGAQPKQKGQIGLNRVQGGELHGLTRGPQAVGGGWRHH
jgi:catechol-2,3-dioxygenase